MMFTPPTSGPLWLASRSPRRQRMLNEAGVSVRVCPAEIDEAELVRGPVPPAHWVMALAYVKARWVAEALRAKGVVEGTVLGADTVCVHGGRIFGQPRASDEARRMLRAMRDNAHETMTGLCLLPLGRSGRWLLVDRTIVRWGHIDNEQIERYISGGQWRGKAGGYNLIERLEEGWPITCEGDPHTVMGLPMGRLAAWLGSLREMQA